MVLLYRLIDGNVNVLYAWTIIRQTIVMVVRFLLTFHFVVVARILFDKKYCGIGLFLGLGDLEWVLPRFYSSIYRSRTRIRMAFHSRQWTDEPNPFLFPSPPCKALQPPVPFMLATHKECLIALHTMNFKTGCYYENHLESFLFSKSPKDTSSNIALPKPNGHWIEDLETKPKHFSIQKRYRFCTFHKYTFLSH